MPGWGCEVNFFRRQQENVTQPKERDEPLGNFPCCSPIPRHLRRRRTSLPQRNQNPSEHGQKVELLTFDFDATRYRDIVGEDFPKQVTVHSLGKRTEEKPPFTIYKRHRNFVKLLKKYRNTAPVRLSLLDSILLTL